MFLAVFFVMMFLGGRLVYLMVFCSEYYGQKAEDLHERERDIKAARGRIIDATGKILDCFFDRQFKLFQVLRVFCRVPLAVDRLHHLSHILCLKHFRQIQRIKYDANLFFDLQLVLDIVLSKDLDLTLVSVDQV